MPHRRRAATCQYGMYQAGARAGFRPGCGRLQNASQEQERGQKRRARTGYHHGDPKCMCYRCDSLPGPDPGDTLAIDLEDGDDFSCGCSGERIFTIAAVACHTCLLSSARVVVAKLAKFSGFEQPLALIN